jgi:predicted DNA-binding helix-hairpin-helix protein
MSRVYFSAYQRGLGDGNLPGEVSGQSNEDILTREHRLYQVDWLLRKYKFSAGEIPFDRSGNLYLEVDPKEAWARQHPEFFPVNINKADKLELLRVPGLGHVTVDKIIKNRKDGCRFWKLADLGRVGKRLLKAQDYIRF